MVRNERNPKTVDRKKTEFEIQYYGMSFEDFIKIYGDCNNYNSSDIIDYLTQ